jgi:hypothetical protein
MQKRNVPMQILNPICHYEMNFCMAGIKAHLKFMIFLMQQFCTVNRGGFAQGGARLHRA